MPGLFSKRSPLTVTGSITSADASTPRSYVEFIDGAYLGALGRFPTCFEEQAEYNALSNAAAANSLRQEAERFVSTLFETQASFDDTGGTYCQSPEYETLNPASCDPFINARSDVFITDLYEGFLLREPEPDGFNGWMQIIPSAGRKGVLNGFRFSVEFGVLVDALYQGLPPDCPPDEGEGGPCERGSLFYARLCP
ncbi:MAG TPA: DUF4214 domain-containing protein [Pyrinomonadaceae bacterium]